MTDYTAILKESEARASKFLEQVEQRKIEYLTSIADFIRHWYLETAGEQACKKPDITDRLGHDTLRQMKNQVRALSDNSMNIVQKHFVTAQLWWSADITSTKPHPIDINQLDDTHEGVLRRVLGELVVILRQFGYDPKPEQGDKTPLWHAPYEKPRSVTEAWRIYKETAAQAQDSILDRMRCKQLKREQDAKKLWESL